MGEAPSPRLDAPRWSIPLSPCSWGHGDTWEGRHQHLGHSAPSGTGRWPSRQPQESPRPRAAASGARAFGREDPERPCPAVSDALRAPGPGASVQCGRRSAGPAYALGWKGPGPSAEPGLDLSLAGRTFRCADSGVRRKSPPTMAPICSPACALCSCIQHLPRACPLLQTAPTAHVPSCNQRPLHVSLPVHSAGGLT